MISLFTPLLSVLEETLSDSVRRSLPPSETPPFAVGGQGRCSAGHRAQQALGKVGSVPGGRGAALPPVPLLSLGRSKASTGAAEAGAGDSCEEPEQPNSPLSWRSRCKPFSGGFISLFFTLPLGSVLVWSPWCLPCCVSSVCPA